MTQTRPASKTRDMDLGFPLYIKMVFTLFRHRHFILMLSVTSLARVTFEPSEFALMNTGTQLIDVT